MDGVELHQTDKNKVDGDDVVQQTRDDQNEYPGNDGDERRDMSGGDDHDFPRGLRRLVGFNGRWR